MTGTTRFLTLAALGAAMLGGAQGAKAVSLNVVNHGFEDTTGQVNFNEFTFGTPAGWVLYDPQTIVAQPQVYIGTLEFPNAYFDSLTAPEGDRVSILFNAGREGEGEYGYQQTLANIPANQLAANTQYTLSVEVGNIGSGTAEDNTFFNLDEFPGYRVELLAGGQVLAADNNLLTIAEREFATSTVIFSTGPTHLLLGQPLGIRLVNLNVIPNGYTQETSPDLEVDFDDVRLTAVAIPEPTTLTLLLFGLIPLVRSGRRRRVCSR